MKIDKFYVGACQDSLELRICKHNSGFYGKTTFTSQTDDWSPFLNIPVLNYSHALKIEKKIKAMKSKKFIIDLFKYETLRNKLIQNTLIN